MSKSCEKNSFLFRATLEFSKRLERDGKYFENVSYSHNNEENLLNNHNSTSTHFTHDAIKNFNEILINLIKKLFKWKHFTTLEKHSYATTDLYEKRRKTSSREGKIFELKIIYVYKENV